ncbi:MAG TPA: penicillin-binding transpeptidase domain-containing protein [Acidimicrobiales bacterium]|nr:penicillin-binding transpeptidase domain-containing protein [Acidimicrobiales bacterium]
MGRRIRWLGVVMVACLGLVVAQLVNIQLVKAKQLQTSPFNPRVAALRFENPRGSIYAADGTVLAQSVPTPAGTNKSEYPYTHIRQYPQGPLLAGITGYDSALYYGTSDIEQQYDSYLGAHRQVPQTLSQLIFRQEMPVTTDDVTLTVEPNLQQTAWNALVSTPGNNDGAVVVLDPKTGAVLAMVSNPTYDPNALVSTSLHAEQLAYYSYVQKDHEGFSPLRPIATGETFFPGSTMKVVTSTAAYNLKPSLAGFNYPVQPCQSFPDSNRVLCNDGSNPSNSKACGGTMTSMLPESCDPGYGELGVQEGVSTLRQQAEMFGINSVPPIDLPGNTQQPVGGVVASTLKTLPPNSQAFQAYSAIGQDYVQDTALQNAMVAAGIANGGVIMTPHLMSSIHDSQGALVQSYTPTGMPRTATAQAAQSVTALMESVPISGTASGVGFPSYLCAAVKTGTAQTGLGVNHDWMIGFAPANDPKIAVAVVVPYQNISSDGAGIAGPIVNKVMQAALPPGSVQQPCTVPAPPLSTYGPQTQAPIFQGTGSNNG